ALVPCARRHHLPDLSHPGDRRTSLDPHRRDRPRQAGRPGTDRRAACRRRYRQDAGRAVDRVGWRRSASPQLVRLDLTMLRILKAFAWLRWRMLVNALERTGSRDALERFSIAIEKLGPILAGILMIPSALGIAV